MTIDEATAMILTELDRAKSLHKFPTDIIHQGAIVGEECGELIKAINELGEGKSTMEDVIREAVHTGATIYRLLTNLKECRV